MNNIRIVFVLLFTISFNSNAQNSTAKDWALFQTESPQNLTFSKSVSKTLGNLTFAIIWDKKLSHSNNIGYYGGIAELDIYCGGEKLQTIHKIEDGIGLGEISFTFYDYNLDGYIDFTIPIDCGRTCFSMYYLYHPELQKFIHQPEWDYLRIQQINKKTKEIITQPTGNYKDAQTHFKIKGYQLISL